MSPDPYLLRAAAKGLRAAAWELDDSVRRLRSGVEQQVVVSPRGWKGPAADEYMNHTRDRYNRMRHSSDQMRDLAGQMDRAAQRIDDEERERSIPASAWV